MKKTNLFILLCLFATSQLFAQQSQLIMLDLSKPTKPDSFTLNAQNVWTGTYEDFPFITFNDSTFTFNHGGYGFYWDGFTYSKNANNTEQANWSPGDEFGNMAGGGIKTDAVGNVLKNNDGVVMVDLDAPYLVVYASDWTLATILFDDVYQAEGVYVNNNPWPYYENINGGAFGARPLNQDGDYFKLIIHGLGENHEDNGKTVEYYLAQNTNGTLIQSTNWEWIDLSGLGEVSGIYFTMESTDVGEFGINTATFFCMDKLQVRTKDVSTNESAWSKFHVYSHRNTVYINSNVGTWHTTSIPMVEIWDMTGRLVHRTTIHEGNTAITLSVADGIYNVVVRGRDLARHVSTKVLITK